MEQQEDLSRRRWGLGASGSPETVSSPPQDLLPAPGAQDPWKPGCGCRSLLSAFPGGLGQVQRRSSAQLTAHQWLPTAPERGVQLIPVGRMQFCGATHVPRIRTAALGKRRLTSQPHTRDLHFYFALSLAKYVSRPWCS